MSIYSGVKPITSAGQGHMKLELIDAGMESNFLRIFIVIIISFCQKGFDYS